MPMSLPSSRARARAPGPPAGRTPALRTTSRGPTGGVQRFARCSDFARPRVTSGLHMRQLSCGPCGALGCSARRGARSGALGRNKGCMAARGWRPAHKAAEALRARRELQDRPKQILGGLPTRPDEYRALGPAIAPRPRTIKLARPSSSFCGCRARGLRACMPDTRARWPTCPARAACMKMRERGRRRAAPLPSRQPPVQVRCRLAVLL